MINGRINPDAIYPGKHVKTSIYFTSCFKI